jgi:hypothetical protein
VRIAVVESVHSAASATGVRGRAIAAFLRARGHEVDVVAPSERDMQRLSRRQFGLLRRLRQKLIPPRELVHAWDLLADLLEPRLRAGRYDAIVARSRDVGYVLTRGLPGFLVYDMANLGFLEEYYAWGANLRSVNETYRREIAMLERVDAVLSPHPVFTKYLAALLDAVAGLEQKTVTVRLGAEPAGCTAGFASPPAVVYAGSYHFIQDPWMLSELTKRSRFQIDCYGFRDPNQGFLPARLNYRGYAPSMDFLASYQFGLITLSRDRLRQHSPATKFPYYFMHGLPVLFPEWMLEGYEYPDCAIPYNEDTFDAQVERASDRERWAAMSAAALERGGALRWDIVLQPLETLLRQPVIR